MKTLAGIAIAFVAVEAALRLLGFPTVNTNTFDGQGLVIFKPNQSFLVKDRCYASTVRSNEFGFNARSYATEKPAGTYRIALVGDSFVEAVQVPREKNLASLLEERLNEGGGGRKYEVIPIGKSGNGTIKNMMYAREYALRYHPDLIVDAFVSNDLADDAKPEQVAPPTGNPLALYAKHFLLERSLTLERWWINFQVAKSQWGRKAAPAAGSALAARPIDSFVEAQMEPQSDQSRALWAGEEKALGDFDRLAGANGAKFMLVQLAEGYQIDPPELASRYGLDQEQASRFDPDLLRRKLAAIAAKQGFAFFSTEPAFAANLKGTGKLPVLSCDNHYSELGHQWAADAIYGFLRTRL